MPTSIRLDEAVNISATKTKYDVQPILSESFNIQLQENIGLASDLYVVAEIFKLSWDVHLPTVCYCGRPHKSLNISAFS